uniref:Beclin1 isoform X1 n=1 Tax=Brachionus koreanus TaxID=1199090 RepID=A0A2Z4EUT8_9BILA|nr:beclin1 isoform X1 [Brachionus koreanus]
MDQSDIDQSIVVTGISTSKSDTNLMKNTASLQKCQLCGVLLNLDSNLNEASLKQLTTTTYCQDDLDTVFSGNIVDPEMELSISPIGTGYNNEIERSTNTYFEDDIDLSSKNLEPDFKKQIPPRNFYLCPTTINIVDSTSNNQSTINTDQTVDWHSRISSITALFDMISSTTNIDHPLCEECADRVVNELDTQCIIADEEQKKYQALIKRLKSQMPDEEEIKNLEKELAALDSEEKKLRTQLEISEKEENDLIEMKNKLSQEETNLINEEQNLMLEYSNLKRQLVKLEENYESLENQHKNAKFHFNRLSSVNVLNAAFHIWHSGPFGTINYFRLGCMPDDKVEWDEINAGLGQANLLLYCLAKKIKLEFQRFRLVPYGSFSYIQVIENDPNYSGFKIGDECNMYEIKGKKYFLMPDKKFDKGMIAFLDCIKQLEERIKTKDKQFSLPYRINGDKLEDKNSSYSVKFFSNSYEHWTKALKFMLTNLKWSLAWLTSQKNNTSN